MVYLLVWPLLCLHRATGPLPRVWRSHGKIQKGSAPDISRVAFQSS
jgi:hypothetical protein